jgi:hypothetical protein
MKDIRIVIAHRGFVWIGEYSEKGDKVQLARAKNIRRWGTTKGLGELRRGPLENTKLDEAGDVELHQMAVISTIKCDPEKWDARLG